MLGYEGPIRDLFLILDGIQFFLCVELACLFIIRGIKKKKGGRVNYGWGLVFLSFANVALMNFFLFYYLLETNPLLWYNNVKINSLIGGAPGIIIIGIMEKYYQKYRKTRFFVTGFYLTMHIVSFFSDELLTSFIGNIALVILGIFVIMFFKKLISQSSGATRVNIFLFTISFFLFMAGILLTNPRIMENQIKWGLDINVTGLIARIGQIASLIIIAAVLLEQPVFYELNWEEKLIQIIIFHKTVGVHIFHAKFQDIKFREDNRNIPEALIAGGMMGISAMLKEISQSSEELKIIDQDDQKILLEHGENFVIALNVLEEFRIFWDKLKKLRNVIEDIWGVVLKNFDGVLDYFTPIGDLIKNEFGTELLKVEGSQ